MIPATQAGPSIDFAMALDLADYTLKDQGNQV
jgi:hypothetical protein